MKKNGDKQAKILNEINKKKLYWWWKTTNYKSFIYSFSLVSHQCCYKLQLKWHTAVTSHKIILCVMCTLLCWHVFTLSADGIGREIALRIGCSCVSDFCLQNIILMITSNNQMMAKHNSNRFGMLLVSVAHTAPQTVKMIIWLITVVRFFLH